MWITVLIAVALVLLIEGILPFLAPKLWRQMMQNLATRSNRAIRLMGLSSMLIGVLLMIAVHKGFF